MRSPGICDRANLRLAACCLALMLAGCKDAGDPGRRRGQAGSDSDLPAPEARGGSVTGMPDAPGPGQIAVPVDGALPPDTPIAGDGSLGPPPIDDGSLPGNGAQAFPGMTQDLPDGTSSPSPGDEPSADEAVAVVRDYYAAINERQYAHAYALWSDGGRSSGQGLQQFADGFADTVGVSVQIDAPSRIDAAAGSRYIEVPVAITATRPDGGEQHYVGIYTLHRAVADGASPAQRQWQIHSADLRQVRP